MPLFRPPGAPVLRTTYSVSEKARRVRQIRDESVGSFAIRNQA